MQENWPSLFDGKFITANVEWQAAIPNNKACWNSYQSGKVMLITHQIVFNIPFKHRLIMRNVEHHAQCIQCYQQCSHVQLLLVCVPKMTSTSIYSSSCNFITMQKNSRTLGSTAYER